MAQTKPPSGNLANMRPGGKRGLQRAIVVREANELSAEIQHEKVQDGVTGETRDFAYTAPKIVGNGSFGVVFQAKDQSTGDDIAIKRVLQDKRFKVCPELL